MSDALLISVRLHEGWYHGASNTPSPARMFQALIAGAGISGPLDEATVSTLTWLERQPPPIVAVPSVIHGQKVVNFVPNNDLDSRQGDHRRIGEIRTKKPISPLLFNPETPFLFAWNLCDDNAAGAADGVCQLADRVYQLGRGVDMAWAWGEVLSSDNLHDRLISYPGIVRHPSLGMGDVDCPTSGSLESLNRRHAAAAQRFDRTADGKGQTFRQQPKPKWRKINYEGIGDRVLLELRRAGDAAFAPWPLERTSELVELLRNGMAQKLHAALSDQIPDIDRVLIGRKPNGKNDGPTAERVRIIPLPSIGHSQADMKIRRILIDIPGECPIRSDDISWAVSGLQLVHPVSSEAIDVTISNDQSQLSFFGANSLSRTWRSVTPVALPEATRRRIDPSRRNAEAKSGHEKYQEQVKVSFAVTEALRHAGIGAKVTSVRAQREPFDLRGIRCEPFSDGTRFSKYSLWHLELEFESPLSGPLLIGNGRFLGLGLMKPVPPTNGIFGFDIVSGLNSNPDPIRLSDALRRAVMARVRDVLGTSRIGPYFSGHSDDGSPSRSEEEPHLAYLFNPTDKTLFVIAPEHLDKRKEWWDYKNLATLETALQDFQELWAGPDGQLRLRRTAIDLTCHQLFAPSHVWVSVTPYQVNRHSKRSTADATLKNDVVAECERRGLPCPEITVLKWNADRGTGLNGKLRLEFREATQGPVILGRTRHTGGGIFASPSGS